MSKFDEMRKEIGPRYISQCIKLTGLANYALNKPKNVSKPDFELLPLDVAFALLQGEISELHNEILLTKQMDNYERVLDELADVAGTCVGLLAIILKEMEK